MRGSRGAVAVLAACVLLAGCGGGSSTPKAAPAPHDVHLTVLTWNMSGWSGQRGSPRPADTLAGVVQKRDPKPLVVVTNEICDSQYQRIADALRPLGYTGAPSWSIPNFGQPNCRSFGDAVFWQGSASGVQPRTYPASAQANGASTQEKRTLVCVRLTEPVLRVCGTHLHQFEDVAARQLTVARQWFASEAATSPPTLLVGDLNLKPTDPAMNAEYAENVEGDPRPRNQAVFTQTNLAKLDYVFAPKAVVVGSPSSEVLPQQGVSDHGIYVANFVLSLR